MNYLPFDLETALKNPERVVTRDGRKVSQLVEFKGVTDTQPLACVLNSEVEFFYRDGFYSDRRNSINDLFLLPEVKECWVNVYETEGGFIDIGAICHTTLDNAIIMRDNERKYIKTIRITNEPE